MLEQIEKWTSLVLANLLWAMFAIPLVTMPVATAALFAVMSKRVRGKNPELFQVFFGTMRHLWLKATLVGLIDLAVGALLFVNLQIFGMMPTMDPIAFLSRSVTLFTALMLVLTNFYAWSLMVIDDMSVTKLIQTSYMLVFAHPLWSCGVLIAAAVPLAVSLLLPRGVFLILTASCCVLVITMGTWPIIQRHGLANKVNE